MLEIVGRNFHWNLTFCADIGNVGNSEKMPEILKKPKMLKKLEKKFGVVFLPGCDTNSTFEEMLNREEDKITEFLTFWGFFDFCLFY